MAFTRLLLAVVVCLSSTLQHVDAAVAADATKSCKQMEIRKEWRTLSDEQQLSYVEAIQCLTKLPSKHPIHSLPGIISRYDDFVAGHIAMAPKTHYVGQFLPWHRYFLITFEHALRDECKYDAPLPYWDWNLDVPPKGKWDDSPVFNVDTGFGGDGPFEPTPAVSINSKKRRRSLGKRAQKAVSAKDSTNARLLQQQAFDQAKEVLKVYRSTKAEIARARKLQSKPLVGGTEFNFRPKGAPASNSSSSGTPPSAAAPAPAPGGMAGMPGMAVPAAPQGTDVNAPSNKAPGIQGTRKQDPSIHPPNKWIAGLAELGLDVSQGMPVEDDDAAAPAGMDDHGEMDGGAGMGNMTGGMGDGMGGHEHQHPADAGPDADAPVTDPNFPAAAFAGGAPDSKHYGGGCITEGPFAKYNVTLGPGLNFDNNPHCIRRDFMTDSVSVLAADNVIKYIINAPNYYMLGAVIDPVHEVGHAGVGGFEGNMANLFSSLTDPIFWLHHGNMDRIWWSWQLANPAVRFKDIESPEIDPDHGANITMDYLLRVGFTGPVRPVKDFMDLRAWPWCRDYDSVYQP